MNCPVDGVRLQVTHVYTAGTTGKTATAECPTCGRRYTTVSFVLGEAGEVGGAYAVAGKMRKGKGPRVAA